MKHRDLLAVSVILLAWDFNERSLLMSTPRYLAHVTTSRMSLWRVYVVGRGDRDRVLCIAWHLLGLNSMSHLVSHSWRISRSACSCSESDCLVMAR